ncbi:hypothetical protein C0W59_22095 [Photobacterium kishitanii]|uniref:hypothetical protein n=1 Tax=Photobacterium kishitanii TaxID=318456 RepID=UPI000D173EAD|nr:hypothetical protein [Photobacterium kishitanii]PSV09568.1 hypothetical protein C0W59_22095 [Photobacterium kishitanii]
MKKTLLALVTLSSLGMASSVMAAAGDAMPVGTASFQWAGTVPTATNPGAGYFIIQEGDTNFTDGVLTFTNIASGGVKLNGSNEIGFKVVKDKADDGPYKPADDVTPLPYKGTLTSIKVGINGFVSEQVTDGYFNIFADSQKLVVNTADSINKSAANNITRLTVKPKDANANADLNASDAVVVQALIAVNPTDV